MKKIAKKLLVVMTVLSLLTLAACGGEKAEPGSSKASNNGSDTGKTANTVSKSVEIRFSWWGDTKRNEIYNAICDKFEQANQGIKIVREASSWNDYWDKLATQTAGGNAPDAMGMHPNFASDYARRKALLPIDDFVKSGVINLKDFPQSVVDGGKIDGVNYMVAQGVTFTNQMTNKSLFEKLKVEYPTNDWTWDDFAKKANEIAQAAKKAGLAGHYGTNDYSNMLQFFRYQVRQDGRDLYDKNGDINFTEADVEKWFSFWKGLRDSGAIPDAATTNEHAKDTLEQQMFTQGKIGFALTAVNQLHLYKRQMADANLGLLRNPKSASGKNGTYIEGAFFAISAKADKAKQEAAAKFISFFVNNDEAMKIFKVEQGVPGSTKMAEVVKPLLNEAQQTSLDFVKETLKNAETVVYPPKGAGEIDAAFKDAAQKVAYGESPAKIAKAFVEQAKSIVAKNKQ